MNKLTIASTIIALVSSVRAAAVAATYAQVLFVILGMASYQAGYLMLAHAIESESSFDPVSRTLYQILWIADTALYVLFVTPRTDWVDNPALVWTNALALAAQATCILANSFPKRD